MVHKYQRQGCGADSEITRGPLGSAPLSGCSVHAHVVSRFEWHSLRFSAEITEELLYALSSITSVPRSRVTQKREICEFSFFHSLQHLKFLIIMAITNPAHSVPSLRIKRSINHALVLEQGLWPKDKQRQDSSKSFSGL